MTIPQKHIYFAKDNLAHIAAADNDVENGHKAEDGDEETQHRWELMVKNMGI